MSSRHRNYYEGLEKISKEENVNTRVANDVLYLRQQPHHSQALERDFIDKAKTGEVPDVTNFGRESPKRD